MTDWRVIVGDCLEVMSTIDPESISAIVTDPPYGLGFMAKHWDRGVPGVEFWRRAFRVLKPGAHLLAFGGTRTHHRLWCAIEDAGFEIRDTLSWMYGSGFPKSLDVGKAIDKAAGVERKVVGHHGQTMPQISPRENFGDRYGDEGGNNAITAPATDAAREWDGWGTALKPAWEPIIMARKPLTGTVAANVQEHGTGAINVEGCRVGTEDTRGKASPTTLGVMNDDGWKPRPVMAGSKCGRWPANVCLDEHAAAMLDEQSGELTSGRLGVGHGSGNTFGVGNDDKRPRTIGKEYGNDTGGASRFFYCAKASRSERETGVEYLEPKSRTDVTGRADESAGQNNPRAGIRATGEIRNVHPTVKPIDLMRWLVRLVTPAGGTVLDPFCGSGSTGVACGVEGFDFVGIEIDPEYAEIARARVEAANRQLKLF